MKKLLRYKLTGFALAAAFGIVLATVPASANATNQSNPTPPVKTVQAPVSRVGSDDLIHGHPFHLKRARAAVALDGRTGQVVYQKHANQKRLVASTGKLMTLYLAEKKLARNPQAWHYRVKASRPIIRMGHNASLDGFRFEPGRSYSIRELFEQAFVASDDNSAIRLGQWVGGTNRNFVRMMNAQARQWHLRASFTSASGLENNDLAPYGFWIRGPRDGGNRISAKSLAIIAYHLIKRFPSVMKYSRIRDAHIDGQNLHNYNNLLPGRRYYQPSLDVDGLKTGYTPAAGYCFVGTGKRPGHDRLITVVLHDPTEFSDTDELMHHVYRYSKLFK